MKNLFLLTLLTLLSSGLFGQEKILKDISETEDLSKLVVSHFLEGEVSQAFEELSKYWPMPANELVSIEEKTIKYLNLLSPRFGEKVDTLKVKNETISDIAIRETYLLRYEKSAIRLIITYYRNDRGWIVNSFKWDDSFAEEFK